MLVVVGRPGNADALRPTIETMRAKPRERAGLQDLLDRYAKS